MFPPTELVALRGHGHLLAKRKPRRGRERGFPHFVGEICRGEGSRRSYTYKRKLRRQGSQKIGGVRRKRPTPPVSPPLPTCVDSFRPITITRRRWNRFRPAEASAYLRRACRAARQINSSTTRAEPIPIKPRTRRTGFGIFIGLPPSERRGRRGPRAVLISGAPPTGANSIP